MRRQRLTESELNIFKIKLASLLKDYNLEIKLTSYNYSPDNNIEVVDPFDGFSYWSTEDKESTTLTSINILA
jgi:hypothetical protein